MENFRGPQTHIHFFSSSLSSPLQIPGVLPPFSFSSCLTSHSSILALHFAPALFPGNYWEEEKEGGGAFGTFWEEAEERILLWAFCYYFGSQELHKHACLPHTPFGLVPFPTTSLYLWRLGVEALPSPFSHILPSSSLWRISCHTHTEHLPLFSLSPSLPLFWKLNSHVFSSRHFTHLCLPRALSTLLFWGALEWERSTTILLLPIHVSLLYLSLLISHYHSFSF